MYKQIRNRAFALLPENTFMLSHLFLPTLFLSPCFMVNSHPQILIPLTILYAANCAGYANGQNTCKIWQRLAYITMIFPLELLSMYHTNFSMLHHYLHLSQGIFFIFPLISLLTYWLFSSMLFNLHIFVIFPVFFLQLVYDLITLY
ncbi:unnamed protein product [Nyctereutes procyonoides]|uniref:(raccoon dog) hypothetical protein n=1 Tax=Nyctereutes procyonoides TaxID=34880 RepID=A0A811Y0P6_NYCPR|nr:unnamed protein product [Nyctereutes procyonoides]